MNLTAACKIDTTTPAVTGIKHKPSPLRRVKETPSAFTLPMTYAARWFGASVWLPSPSLLLNKGKTW